MKCYVEEVYERGKSQIQVSLTMALNHCLQPPRGRGELVDSNPVT